MPPSPHRPRLVKCVVWDLDNTVWRGVLDEEKVEVFSDAVSLIKTLDEHGILQSIASRSSSQALTFLETLGIRDYFLCPQFGKQPKSTALQAISEHLQVELDAIVFVDDEPFERDEVGFYHPVVRCFEATRLDDLLNCLRLPKVVTDESRQRRQMLLAEKTREEAEDHFAGPREEFLATLGMVLTIAPAQESDLPRLQELLIRTTQFNATGLTPDGPALADLMLSERHDLLTVRLDDSFGGYGSIAVAHVDRDTEVWTIKILAISCRIANRGIGTLLLGHLIRSAANASVRLRCEFVHTERNRPMFVMFRFAGFSASPRHDGVQLLESNPKHIPPIPSYVQIEVQE